jgi:hypothetical protein
MESAMVMIWLQLVLGQVPLQSLTWPVVAVLFL